jgi:membrane-bound lytic murein transglycosylase D
MLNRAFFEMVEVSTQISLKRITDVTGVDASIFTELNPAFRRSTTPPKGVYQILLPIGSVQALQKYLADTDAQNSLVDVEYEVKYGDTLSEIAVRYATSVAKIKQLNNLPSDSIGVGQTLHIEQAPSLSIEDLRRLTYRVRRGDSLYLIAKTFNVTVDDITRWNSITANEFLQPGQYLTLFINPLRI